MSETFSVADKVVVITGAGQGIGRAFAKSFASAGARVVIAERNVEKAHAVAQEIAAGNGHATVVETDVADAESVAALGADVDRQFGRADVLINNAAIFSTSRCVRSTRFRCPSGNRCCASTSRDRSCARARCCR